MILLLLLLYTTRYGVRINPEFPTVHLMQQYFNSPLCTGLKFCHWSILTDATKNPKIGLAAASCQLRQESSNQRPASALLR